MKRIVADVAWFTWLGLSGLAGLALLVGAAAYLYTLVVSPGASLDRAQAAFEADDSWSQGRGYNWPKFHAAKGPDRELFCQDTPDKTVRQCILQMPTFDPMSGEPLGVMPQEFLCSTSSCTWLENLR